MAIIGEKPMIGSAIYVVGAGPQPEGRASAGEGLGSASILLARAGMLPAIFPDAKQRQSLRYRESLAKELSGNMPDRAGNMPALPKETLSNKQTPVIV